MIKIWDGHTHSEFCPHGSKDKTADRIEKAIELGFTHYSITEHAPLPEKLLKEKTTPKDASLEYRYLDNYWKTLKKLKTTYKDKIKIFIGLEIDYLVGYEDWTQSFLTTQQNQLDEIILSLHFLPDEKGNLKMIDKCWGSFESSFRHRGKENIWQLYWETMKKMVSKKWNVKMPIRVGHLALIEKYNRLFKPSDDLRKKWISFILQNILPVIAKQGYSLDFNVAGLRKKECGMPYLYTELLESCKNLAIPLIYGSDSHSIEEVGSHFENYLHTVKI